MPKDIEIIHSPLQQTYSADGHTLSIQIYRSADSLWILEVVDEAGTATVWDDPFETDKAALEAAFLAIEEEGIASFVTQAQQAAKAAAPELLRKLEQSVLGGKYNMMIGPLSEAELDELDQFLLYLDEEESMTLDTLDGFLHAIAIGPETLMPSRWLPRVWGLADGSMVLPGVDIDQMERVLGLVMRHFNSIVFGFGQRPPFVEPLWGTTHYEDMEQFEDAEMWAYGFCEGVKLKRQNQLTDEHIAKIIKTYQFREEEARYARRVEMAEIEKNDFNLNISRYISTAVGEAEIDLDATQGELVKIEEAIAAAKAKHNGFLTELGLKLLP